MPKFLLLLLVVGSAFPAFAAKRVTVQQLQQVLTATRGEPDAKIAGRLTGLELTERLSLSALSHFEAGLPGPKSRRSLLVLADYSAFLDPSPAEIPATAAPDFATQRQIMARTVDYAGKAISRLPDFFATRETIRFADTPAGYRGSYMITFQSLHFVDSAKDTVLYRDGREVVDRNAAELKQWGQAAPGLATQGVFGPILGTVLKDAAHGKVTWSRWEKGPAGQEAVFRFAVPAEESHYKVEYAGIFKTYPGYHGEIAVDPENGTILRLVVEADLKRDSPIARSAVQVDYGPVEIGGKTYVCPVKSVSILLAPEPPSGRGQNPMRANGWGALQTSLNDTAFEQYHLFRAEARILTGDDTGAAGDAPANAPAAAPAGPPVSAPSGAGPGALPASDGKPAKKPDAESTVPAEHAGALPEPPATSANTPR